MLARHKLVDSDERKFGCHLCSYKGKCKYALKIHALTHVDVQSWS